MPLFSRFDLLRIRENAALVELKQRQNSTKEYAFCREARDERGYKTILGGGSTSLEQIIYGGQKRKRDERRGNRE